MYQGGKKCLRHVRLVGNVLAISNWPEIFQLARNVPVVWHGSDMFQACHTTQKSFSLVTWLEHFLPVSWGIWGPSFKKKNLVFLVQLSQHFVHYFFCFLLRLPNFKPCILPFYITVIEVESNGETCRVSRVSCLLWICILVALYTRESVGIDQHQVCKPSLWS